jgi:hypothetical protein
MLHCVSEEVTASIIIALMMAALSFSEMLVSLYKATWCNISEDSHLHTHHHENMKSQLILFVAHVF